MDNDVRLKFDDIARDQDHKFEELGKKVDTASTATTNLLTPLGKMAAKVEFNSIAIWWIITLTIINLLSALGVVIVLLWNSNHGG